jgi:hypothetical protein
MAGGKVDTSANVQKTTNNNASSFDPNSSAYVEQMRQQALAAGNAGPSPLLNGAASTGTNAQTAGNLGFGALSGDPNAMAKLMNPYQQQVLDANNAQWQHTNAQTLNQVNDAATGANAFGGSRQGVAEGVALSNNNMAQQSQTAGLLQSGYNNAIGQASQLAGYGMQGAQMNSNLGFGGVGSPEQWKLNMMNQGWTGPTGQTSSGAQTTAGASAKMGGWVL